MESMHRMMKIQRLQESRAQVVRSVGRWSAGTKTESSTHQAYCDLIQDSKHFIYIENQFFCSGLEGRVGKCWEGSGTIFVDSLSRPDALVPMLDSAFASVSEPAS